MTNRKKTFSLPKEYQIYFWDSDWEDLTAHMDVYRAFIISRLADKGDCDVVKWLRRRYSMSEIKNSISRSKIVTDKTKRFWERYG
jgi:hypothetical protein